jgi:hypothetical protein
VSAVKFRILLVGCIAGECFVSGMNAAQVALAWDPPDGNTDGSSMNNLAGYRVYYGTGSRTYSSTVDVGLARATIVMDLNQELPFFYTASAYNSNGTESALAEELSWTFPVVPPNLTQASVDGIPPVLSLVMEKGVVNMGIKGTVGAAVRVQTSTNLANPLGWELLHNLLLTNIAPSSDGMPPAVPQNTLEAAFVPALEWFSPVVATSSPCHFFRVVMPYSYAILADLVLKSKGYQPRLIVVRLPGETLHDICYVSDDQAYIDCSEDRFILALNYSGATIREIADDYSGYASMNWTSASEFTWANGERTLVSTVVKTDPPSSDPPLVVAPTSSILVNF